MVRKTIENAISKDELNLYQQYKNSVSFTATKETSI